jgi:GNAT superfamily N-acetyltransferase
MGMRLAVCRYPELSESDIGEWTQLARRVHPPGAVWLGSDLQWAPIDPDDDLVRVWDDGELRACAWVTRRTIEAAGEPVRVAGVRGVMTHPEHRRRGYGRIAMGSVHEIIRSLDDCAFALLFSSVMAVPFYEALGWRPIPGPVFCQQNATTIDYTKRLPGAPVMVLMPEAGSAALPSPIDVKGPPW